MEWFVKSVKTESKVEATRVVMVMVSKVEPAEWMDGVDRWKDGPRSKMRSRISVVCGGSDGGGGKGCEGEATGGKSREHQGRKGMNTHREREREGMPRLQSYRVGRSKVVPGRDGVVSSLSAARRTDSCQGSHGGWHEGCGLSLDLQDRVLRREKRLENGALERLDWYAVLDM